jgi:hypothetical protein
MFYKIYTPYVFIIHVQNPVMLNSENGRKKRKEFEVCVFDTELRYRVDTLI